MKTFNPNTGGLETLIERSDDKRSLPNTSRYAWPTTDSGRSSSNRSYPSRSSKNAYFARNSPHPNRVKHMKGLLDVPICTVTDQGDYRADSRFSIMTPNTDPSRHVNLAGIFKLPLNSQYRIKEKAIPTMGLVPLLPDWRQELRRLTEAIDLASNQNQQQSSNNTQLNAPRDVARQGTRHGTRQGTRQASRDAMRKMEEEFVRNSVSRNGQKLSGEDPNAEKGKHETRPSVTREGGKIEKPAELEQMHEDFVFGLLSQILQTDSLQAIQNWLVNAPEREKQIVMDMIKAVSTSDREFREGMQRLRHPAASMEVKNDMTDSQRPQYDDQLLQHEASIDRNEIDEYNKEWKETEAKIRQAKPKSLLEKLEKDSNDKKKTEKSSYADYEWSAESAANKPSTPFKLFTKEKPKPGTAAAEIEEIRSKLASRSSVKVFDHQKPISQRAIRPATEDGAKKPSTSPRSEKGDKKETVKSIAPFKES